MFLAVLFHFNSALVLFISTNDEDLSKIISKHALSLLDVVWKASLYCV